VPFKQLDSLINANPNTSLVPQCPKSKRTAGKIFSHNNRVPVPVPADGVLFGVIEAMEALNKCPNRKMKAWIKHWIEK
jgi:hypothetical protein